MADATLQRTAVILIAFLASGTARAEEDAGTRDVAAEVSRVPDASLRAVKDRVVQLELDGAAAVEGRLLAFEETSVTIAVSVSNEVVSVPREQVLRLILVDAPPVAVAEPAAISPAPKKLRVLGLGVSPLGTLAVDADYKRLHGFASTSLTMPILTASGSSTWSAGALGVGFSLPFGKRNRWRLDAFGGVMPLRTTSHYTYLGFGVGAGVHYTSDSGFTVGFKFPVVGFATRLGSSPTGYDAPFRYNDSLGYYYLAAAAGMPLFTMGYRFKAKRLW